MKRYIKSATYRDYDLSDPWQQTDFIDESVPEAVQQIIQSDEIDYSVFQTAVNAFWEDYEKFPNQNSRESMDMNYDDDKGRFYKKYKKFADTCKEIEKEFNKFSGYGRDDILKGKIRDLARSVTYNFPYGWKYNVR